MVVSRLKHYKVLFALLISLNDYFVSVNQKEKAFTNRIYTDFINCK
ncbi:hypothetical protein B4117_1744 [Bacillus mycoides]|nr:hypothetical protein B4117_1744 [Bacillus mycoides]